MRIVIIGAVAAGTSAGAKARRNCESAEIVIYEKDQFISYSGCGMPYHIGGEIEEAEDLYPRDPDFFKKKYNIDILTLHEVVKINASTKQLTVINHITGEQFVDTYDKLVIATGASAIVPPIEGSNLNHVFTLRNINDMLSIKKFINTNSPKKAVIVGTGFIGLEVCENLRALGMDVTMVERLPQVTPGLDSEMSVYVKEHLEKNKVRVLNNTTVKNIKENKVLLSNGEELEGHLVLLSTGAKPNTLLAKEAGIELGASGAIKVSENMRTNLEDIYACGDCAEQLHVITGKPVYRPLGSTANKMGRIAGDALTGGSLEFRGILGTSIFKVFDLVVGQTGLSEREAKEQGYEVLISHNIKLNKPEYMGGKELIIKAVADKMDGRILGVQIIGSEGVDKRLDVFVTAITLKAKAEDLFHLDLAYAPPFSTTKDPVMYTGMILDNALSKGRPLITASELDQLIHSDEKYILVDARAGVQYEKNHIDTALSIPHGRLRGALSELDKNAKAITYCNKGVTGNAAQNILLNHGFKEVYNLSGGIKQFGITKKSKE